MNVLESYNLIGQIFVPANAGGVLKYNSTIPSAFIWPELFFEEIYTKIRNEIYKLCRSRNTF
jgi:hypothetical protein